MSDDKPQRFSDELAKNAKKGRGSEVMGLAIGAGIGAAFASLSKLKSTDYMIKVFDLAFFGMLGGMIGRLWNERRDNQNSAVKLDSKMMHLEHENKWLKHAVVELGGDVPELKDNHADKIKSDRAAAEDCKCHLKK